MHKLSGQDASLLAIRLIEEQLQMLPVAVGMLLRPTETGVANPDLLQALMQGQRKRGTQQTGSGGNIAAEGSEAGAPLDFDTATQMLLKNEASRTTCLRVVAGNALLAVGMFLRAHEMASMRTPEIQFLGHVCDAILNANRFTIDQGYMPIATFDGLVIDSTLDGTLLFGDGVDHGFLNFGDAVALLQWLARYLRGEKNFVTGGDAG